MIKKFFCGWMGEDFLRHMHFRKQEVLFFLALIKDQRPDIDKICLYVKDPFKSIINCLSTKEKKQELKN